MRRAWGLSIESRRDGLFAESVRGKMEERG